MRGADCGARIADCGMRGLVCGVQAQSAGCKARGARCGVGFADKEFRDVGGVGECERMNRWACELRCGARGKKGLGGGKTRMLLW